MNDEQLIALADSVLAARLPVGLDPIYNPDESLKELTFTHTTDLTPEVTDQVGRLIEPFTIPYRFQRQDADHGVIRRSTT